MKIVESILYILFIGLAFLKCFAISKIWIQDYSSYGIITISFFFIVFNLRLLTKKTIFVMSLYLLSLFLSATYILSFLIFTTFLNSLLFPLLFITSYIYFYKQPDKIKSYTCNSIQCR